MTGDKVPCAARVYDTPGRSHPCRRLATWWVSFAGGTIVQPLCGTHANVERGDGIRRYRLITGTYGRDRAWAEEGDVS